MSAFKSSCRCQPLSGTASGICEPRSTDFGLAARGQDNDCADVTAQISIRFCLSLLNSFLNFVQLVYLRPCLFDPRSLETRVQRENEGTKAHERFASARRAGAGRQRCQWVKMGRESAATIDGNKIPRRRDLAAGAQCRGPRSDQAFSMALLQTWCVLTSTVLCVVVGTAAAAHAGLPSQPTRGRGLHAVTAREVPPLGRGAQDVYTAHSRHATTSAVSSFTSYVGLNTHFIQPEPGEFDMMEGAGVRWIRTDISWQAVEPVKGGPYNFSSFDTLFAQLKQRSMGIIGILGYVGVHVHACGAS